MKLLPDDIKIRASLALKAKETGDYEVICYLAENDLVEKWERDGRVIDNTHIKAACAAGFEVRP